MGDVTVKFPLFNVPESSIVLITSASEGRENLEQPATERINVVKNNIVNIRVVYLAPVSVSFRLLCYFIILLSTNKKCPLCRHIQRERAAAIGELTSVVPAAEVLNPVDEL
jgi:hypothetical protein